MVFWALMADRFSLEQSKRLFGAIAVGGTIGAIVGPWLASMLARPLGAPALLLVSAVLPVPGGGRRVAGDRLQPEAKAAGARRRPCRDRPRGHRRQRLAGHRRACCSRATCSGISLYVLLLTVIATFIYFTRLQMVAALGEDTDMRTTVLAQIDLITQVADAACCSSWSPGTS